MWFKYPFCQSRFYEKTFKYFQKRKLKCKIFCDIEKYCQSLDLNNILPYCFIMTLQNSNLGIVRQHFIVIYLTNQL